MKGLTVQAPPRAVPGQPQPCGQGMKPSRWVNSSAREQTECLCLAAGGIDIVRASI